MLISKVIEAKIVAAIKTAIGTGCPLVEGAWQVSLGGLVKWVDGADDDAAFISVSVGCPAWDVASNPTVSFTARISLFVRPELDTDGSKMNAAAEKIEDMLRGWQLAAEDSPFTALDTDDMSIDGIDVSASAAPAINDGVAVINWDFVLSGSYEPQTQTN